MNYDEKLAISIDRVSSFMRIYTPPKSMTEDDQIKAVISIAQSVARKIGPQDADRLHEIFDKTFEAVADHHESYAWPPQAVFIKHLAYQPEPTGFDVYSEDKSMDIAEKRMARGEPVGDRYVFGAASGEMGRRVGSHVVERYRKGLGYEFGKVYKERAAEMIVAKYGEWAAKYV